MDGDHPIERSYEVTVRTQQAMYAEMAAQGVHLAGTILKASMVVSGKDHTEQAGVDRGRGPHRRVPPRCGSGRGARGGVPLRRAERGPRDGPPECDERALRRAAWALSFSYGRALQDPALRAWAGKAANAGRAQALLAARERLNATRLPRPLHRRDGGGRRVAAFDRSGPRRRPDAAQTPFPFSRPSGSLECLPGYSRFRPPRNFTTAIIVPRGIRRMPA